MKKNLINILFLIFFNTILTSPSFANSAVRTFQAVNGKEIIFLQKLTDIKNTNKFIFMIKNSELPENDKAFIFTENNSRWIPANESINLVLIDSNRKTLVKGTLKNELTLAGIKKDLTFYEVSKVKEIPNLQDLYDSQEGQKYKSEKNINIKAQELIKTSCQTDIIVNIDKSFEVSTLKTLAATEGFIELCSDKDFKEAIQDLKKIDFKSTSKNESPKVSINKNLLIIDLGKTSENTAYHIRALVSKAL